MSADLHTLCALIQQSTLPRYSGVRSKSRVLMPRTKHSGMGISRLEVQRRMRVYWRVEWTYERVSAVIEEMARRGLVMLTSSGYRLVDADGVAALAEAT